MIWTQQFDSYCERTDLSYWSEPLNALTNMLYLIGAIYMFQRSRGDATNIARTLSVLLGLIAIGSYLFHTHATFWAMLTDVIPIGLFILVYLFAVGRDFLNWPLWGAIALTIGFVPFAAIMVPLLDRIPFIGISNFYWTVPILLIGFAPLVVKNNRSTAIGMVAGALLLSLSITVRSLDLILCDLFPTGTHIFWHGLNAIMLPMMIEIYRRHMLASPRAQG